MDHIPNLSDQFECVWMYSGREIKAFIYKNITEYYFDEV